MFTQPHSSYSLYLSNVLFGGLLLRSAHTY